MPHCIAQGEPIPERAEWVMNLTNRKRWASSHLGARVLSRYSRTPIYRARVRVTIIVAEVAWPQASEKD
ncbi:hypothetical protein O181_017544 [Austropuccinia psidii MF-1]|uniref:Uncharacterized protein n=1 Tax=Austropuccinia psidii MF-1 TaxID=1389203 RepID=A0A9Q3C5X8_9BASI|nr:hypothetical protein [Austropuccinia psidii MF-1]